MKRFADIVGAAHAVEGAATDAIAGVVPRWVVRPGTIEEVQACVLAVARDGLTLVPSGLGAHLDRGDSPARADVLLRLDRLAHVVDHQPGDMTITTRAGCPLPILAATLARARQWLPIDPPIPARTTIGGLVAADLSGPLRASQGRVRDLLLGLRVVGADGALVTGGGRVVKNVAGYDLPKLHVGALGTVGVIVEATFKVRPRPECEAAVVVGCESLEATDGLLTTLLAADVEPLWLDVAMPGKLGGVAPAAAHLAVGLGGTEAEVAHGAARVVAIAEAAGHTAEVADDGAGCRAEVAGFAGGPPAIVLRAGVLPADVCGTIAEAQALGGAGVRCRAHAANGVVRIAVVEALRAVRMMETLRPSLARRGGSLVVEHAPPALKREVDVWGDAGPGLPLMRRVKAAFDPGGVFAPGRYVAGL